MSEAIQLYSTVTADPLIEAAQILEQCLIEEQAAMVDLGQGLYYLGWHPMLGRFTIAHRADEAPAALPRFLAMLEEARHVHAGGDSPEQAVEALVALFLETSKHLWE